MLRNSSLRARLLLILLLALLPIFILIATLAYLEVEAEREQARDRIQARAEAALDTARDFIDNAELALELSTAELTGKNGCRTVFSRVRDELPVITNVLTISTSGTITCSAIAEAGGPIDDLSWVDPLIAGEDTFTTNAFFGSQSNRWIFAIFMRHEAEDGSLIDLHAAGLDANLMLDLISAEIDNPKLKAGLIDSEGNIFGYGGLLDLPEKLLIDEIQRDELRRMDLDGADYNVVTFPIGPQNIKMLLATPVPTLSDVLISRPAQIITLPLLALFTAALAVLWALDAFVLRWLTRLSRVVAIYAGGRYELRDDETIQRAPREISELAKGLNQMSNRIAAREDSLEEALELRDGAIKEVHHRVKNNLQIVSSFLNLEARSSQSDEAKAVLAKARTRISALSIVHQTLYQYERLDQVDVQPFLKVLLAHLETALGLPEARITIESEVEEALISSDDAIPLALTILELVTNSMKYAFDRSGGKISVSFLRADPHFKLIVADNGRGEDGSGESGTGLGTRLLNAFARQLGGDIDVATERGRTTTLTFPDKAA